MASKHIRTDVNYAWPSAEIAVMGPEGAVDIVYKRELDAAKNGSTSGAGNPAREASVKTDASPVQAERSSAPALSEREKLRQEKIEEFRNRFANPYIAADRGFLDAVIQPRETRKKLIQALEMLQTKRDKNPPKKHGNIPL
jgi:propionyl-CoA carboxylase beta chain